jgi:hypothetical protein
MNPFDYQELRFNVLTFLAAETGKGVTKPEKGSSL